MDLIPGNLYNAFAGMESQFKNTLAEGHFPAIYPKFNNSAYRRRLVKNEKLIYLTTETVIETFSVGYQRVTSWHHFLSLTYEEKIWMIGNLSNYIETLTDENPKENPAKPEI